MKSGTQVRLIQPEFRGVVKERRFNAEDQIEVLVEWAEADGQKAQRWFTAEQLQEVKE